MGKRYDVPIALISSAKDFTASWDDLGGEIATDGFDHLKLRLDFVANDSEDMRVRVLVKNVAAATDEFSPVVEVLGAAAIAVEPAYWELTDNLDQKLELSYDLKGMTQIVQVQTQAGTVGATPGQVVSASAIVGLING